MSYLADYIFQRHGLESANHLIRTFRTLNLPVPETDQDYKCTAEGGALVFLNRQGCVLRLTKQIFPEYDHPHILQPLATFPDKKIRIELNPGIICPATDMALKIVQEKLKKDNLKINRVDFHEFNVGLLPLKTEEFPEGFPVVIEMPAVSALTKSTKNIAEKLGNRPSPQKDFYAPLREAFRQALHSNDMPSFWRKCEDMKEQGKLIAGWQSAKYRAENKGQKLFVQECNDSADHYQSLCAKHIGR